MITIFFLKCQAFVKKTLQQYFNTYFYSNYIFIDTQLNKNQPPQTLQGTPSRSYASLRC
jgi:hypothetical protein